jgi:hypothetical protein
LYNLNRLIYRNPFERFGDERNSGTDTYDIKSTRMKHDFIICYVIWPLILHSSSASSTTYES